MKGNFKRGPITDFHGLDVELDDNGRVAAVTLADAPAWYAYRSERWPGVIVEDLLRFVQEECAGDIRDASKAPSVRAAFAAAVGEFG